MGLSGGINAHKNSARPPDPLRENRAHKDVKRTIDAA
jgi:hypothetical protein